MNEEYERNISALEDKAVVHGGPGSGRYPKGFKLRTIDKMGKRLTRLVPSEHDLNKVKKKFSKPTKKLNRRANILDKKINKKMSDISTSMSKAGKKIAERFIERYGEKGPTYYGTRNRLDDRNNPTNYLYRINM